jgi:hypothetical protein
MSTRNLSGRGVKGGRRVRLTTSPPSVSRLCRENVGASTSNNPMGLHGLLQGYLYLTLQNVTTNNYDSLIELHTPNITANAAHIKSSVFTSRCFVAASNGGRTPSSGFPNSPRPQLLASHFSKLRVSAVSATTQSQSRSYVTTDGQSASLSWCPAPIWGPRSDFYYSQTPAG